MVNNTRSFESLLKDSGRPLLIGIGGGGDIVGTIPTAGLFRMLGIQCIFAGLPWERSVIDPLPGPRAFDEIRNIKKLNEIIWQVNPDTETINGVKFAESHFSNLIGGDVYLIDLKHGTEGIVTGLLDLIEKTGIDLVVGIDVGGDCIAFGNEPGLQSPLADSMMVAALYEISENVNTMLGVFGYGSDGELSFGELETSVSVIAQHGGYYGAWGVTGNILEMMEKAVSVIPTEASRVPVNISKGDFRPAQIRSGTRNVIPVFSSNITYFFSTTVIYEKISTTAQSVKNTKSFEEANEILNNIGLKTEYDLETEKYGKGYQSR